MRVVRKEVVLSDVRYSFANFAESQEAKADAGFLSIRFFKIKYAFACTSSTTSTLQSVIYTLEKILFKKVEKVDKKAFFPAQLSDARPGDGRQGEKSKAVFLISRRREPTYENGPHAWYNKGTLSIEKVVDTWSQISNTVFFVAQFTTHRFSIKVLFTLPFPLVLLLFLLRSGGRTSSSW